MGGRGFYSGESEFGRWFFAGIVVVGEAEDSVVGRFWLSFRIGASRGIGE
jgi:hypothetical protein